MNNINLAEGIAEETEKIKSSFSQVMKLAIDLKNKCDGIQRLADRRRKSMERLNSEIFELKKERIELRSQRDELKSQIHEITKLLNSWENGSDYEYFIATCDVGTISDFDIIRHIIDVILKPKKAV